MAAGYDAATYASYMPHALHCRHTLHADATCHIAITPHDGMLAANMLMLATTCYTLLHAMPGRCRRQDDLAFICSMLRCHMPHADDTAATGDDGAITLP
jgi:hypothetical protein